MLSVEAQAKRYCLAMLLPVVDRQVSIHIIDGIGVHLGSLSYEQLSFTSSAYSRSR